MSDFVISIDDREGDGDGINEDCNTNKVRFKEIGDDLGENMVVDSVPVPRTSWNDKLLEGRAVGSFASPMTLEGYTDEEFDSEDGDISRSTVNEIPTIDFSEQIQKLLVKDMDSTVMVKLLGCNIGLLGLLYKRRVLEEIINFVGKVAKLDIKTESGVRDRVAKMTVFIDLEKLFTSQILVNGKVQRVEFEALLAVCFTCARYGHLKGLCPFTLVDQNIDANKGSLQADTRSQKVKITATRLEGSKFEALNSLEVISIEKGEDESATLGASLDTPSQKRAEQAWGHSTEREPMGINILKNVSPSISFDNSSMYIKPTFEGPIETVVDLNAEFLDPNRHSAVIFKENFDPNSLTNKVKDGTLSCENPIANAKKVVSGGKGAKARFGKIINRLRAVGDTLKLLVILVFHSLKL
ncbi:hypothetical protein Goshw_020261 [Gossypium schwendimanii]|uniref:CCHC-type domain-containing protein n=1 Tax=Gossypium schwendimanii TaxID=34291 RepID=A0A7J9LAY4_GOSSC|nr:hypothetical protein [Gossypium schwendimanii]